MISILSRLKPIVQKFRTPYARKAILMIATIGLGIGLIWALKTSPDALVNARLGPLALVLLLIVPAITIVNAYEFRVSANLLGKEYSFIKALEVTIIGTATNLLPIPGATIVRVAALRSAGVNTSDGIQAILLVGVMWMGLTFLAGGLALLMDGNLLSGGGFTSIGFVMSLVTFIWLSIISVDSISTIKLVLLKCAMIALDTFRILLCLDAISVKIDALKALVLTVSTIVGSAVSIVPAGLGVREWTQAVLAPLVGVAPADSFLSAVLVRVLGLIFVVPLAFVLSARSKNKTVSAVSGR